MRGYFIAAVAGFVVGILCAPKKGALLREQIKDCFCKMQKSEAEVLDETQRRRREIVYVAAPASTQTNDLTDFLQIGGAKVLSITSARLREVREKSQPSLQKAHERIIEQTVRTCKRLFGRGAYATEDAEDLIHQDESAGLGEVKEPDVADHSEEQEYDPDAPVKRYGIRGTSHKH